MKYLLVIFTLGMFACSANQESRTKEKSDSAFSQVGEKQQDFAGSYGYGPGAEKGKSGTIALYPRNDSTLLFYINLNVGPPSYNGGELFDTLSVKQNQAIYQGSSDYGEKGCKWQIDFESDSLRITTLDNSYDCGFGGNVIADGVYQLNSRQVPQFYIKNQGDTVYFENEIN